MTSLILGSSGQIGSHLVSFLKNKKEKVLEFDISITHKHDLRIPNNSILEDYIHKSDFIFFLAFDVGGSRYLKEYQNHPKFISNNMRIIENTMSLIGKHSKPFIFASSQMSNMEQSTYGVLKNIGEIYTKLLGGLVVKFWNVYGIETDVKKFHVITDFVFKAINNGVIDMLTDGEESRQFLHADDCSNCLSILAEQFYTLDKTKPYHITSFEWIKIIDIAKIISDKTNCGIIKSTQKDDIQLNKLNPPDEYILKFWRPEITIKKGIYKILEHYTNN